MKNISSELSRIHAHLCGDGSVFIFKTKEKDRNNRFVKEPIRKK